MLSEVVDQWIVDVKDRNSSIYQLYTGETTLFAAKFRMLEDTQPYRQCAYEDAADT